MLTPAELKTLGYLLAIGLTLGGFLVIIVFAIACAMSGLTDLSDTEPDQDLDDLQKELDAWREGHGTAAASRLHPALRESGYYDSREHAQREATVRRAVGGSDAA